MNKLIAIDITMTNPGEDKQMNEKQTQGDLQDLHDVLLPDANDAEKELPRIEPHLGELATKREGQIDRYDPEQGLQKLAVAEAPEKHFRRVAKNDPDDPLAREQLVKAVTTKIWAQANYVVWRGGVVVPSRKNPRLRG